MDEHLPSAVALPVTLPDALVIDTVETFTSTLAALPIAQGSVVTCDATALTNITTPGVQALLSLHTTLQNVGGQFIVTGLGEGPKSVFEQIGLKAVVEQWCADVAPNFEVAE